MLAAWSGLGYYRRARLCTPACARWSRATAGRCRATPTRARALPGVGRYTAGAIGSIAFELPEPIVDGNVARVLVPRCSRIDTPLGARDTQRALWAAGGAAGAGRAARRAQPGADGARRDRVQQAASPRCDALPGREQLRARTREGAPQELPVARKKRAPRACRSWSRWSRRATRGDERELLARARRGRAVRRAVEPADGRGPRPRSGRSAARAASALRGELSARRAACAVEHVLTHRRLQVQLWRVQRSAGVDARAAARAAQPLGALRRELGRARHLAAHRARRWRSCAELRARSARLERRARTYYVGRRMQSRWSDSEAQAFVERYRGRCNEDIALRVYSSRLIGREPALVLHGGGNTSVKTRVQATTSASESRCCA